MYSFDLRHQILWMDDQMLIMAYESLTNRMSKTLYISYGLKSLKLTVYSRWDRPPLVFEESNLRNEMQCIP